MTPTPVNAIQRMAVFVDIENVAGYCGYLGVPVDITPVLAQLASLARPIFRRSFGDISALPRPFQPYEVRRMLQQNHIMHEDIPHRPSSYSKNSADIRLVVEAVALAHQRPDLTHFAIFSNDRDFIPLFNHLRELGKVVIGCGPSRAMVNEDYLNACDQFLFHDDIVVVPVASVVLTPPVAAPAENPSEPPSATPAPVPTLRQQEAELAHPATEAAPLSDVERLLAAVHSVQASGLLSVSPQVAGRMKKMFPDFDVKLLFGSFKRFCLAQAETGKIRLENADQPTFLILPDDAPPASPPAPKPATPTEEAPSLTELYRQWVQRKMRITMPSPLVREQLYTALQTELAARPDEMPISLKELSDRAGSGTPEMKNVAFRVFYGLFRSRALHCKLTEDAFNPGVLGLKVEPAQLDSYFVTNTLNSFHHDAAGLPFDEAAWSALMYGEPAAMGAMESTPDAAATPTPQEALTERPSREEAFWLRYPKPATVVSEAPAPTPFTEEAQQLLNL